MNNYGEMMAFRPLVDKILNVLLAEEVNCNPMLGD
jgi:hypothetical protein